MEQDVVKCKTCGAPLQYSPGQQQILCEYCGDKTPVYHKHKGGAQKKDLNSGLQADSVEQNYDDSWSVECPGCGATPQVDENFMGMACPFCGMPLVKDQMHSAKMLRPGWVLPFEKTRKGAERALQDWLVKNKEILDLFEDSNWFEQGELNAVYVPHYTFDARLRAECTLTARLPDVLPAFVNQLIESRIDPSKMKTVVVKLVEQNYIVSGSQSIPENQLKFLGPWKIKNLQPYNQALLQGSGIKTEIPKLSLSEAYDKFRDQMNRKIQEKIQENPENLQAKIYHQDVNYSQEKYRIFLAPVWIFTYRKNNINGVFLINASTGEVQSNLKPEKEEILPGEAYQEALNQGVKTVFTIQKGCLLLFFGPFVFMIILMILLMIFGK